jgi:hypothetical protein
LRIFCSSVPLWFMAKDIIRSVGQLSERTQNAETPSGTPGFSEQALENQQQPRAQEAPKDSGCSIRRFFRETWTEASQFGHGLKAAPGSAVRPSNLKWELPV